MTFKLFIKRFVVISIVSIVLFISFNIYKNEFGLFGNKKNKNIRIHSFEKSSKYLLSFNYIPNNFNGILVGPSLSDQMMDTQNLSTNYDIYNLSMDGANISELKYPIDNILKYGDIKIFVICLDPYITSDSGLKSSQINPKEYYSTLGSMFTIKFYIKKYLDSKKGNKSIYFNSYWGYTNNEYERRDINSTENINKALKNINKKQKHEIKIDKIAYNELKEILCSIRERKIHIVGYYYPTPKRIFNNKYYKESYALYKKEIDKLLDYDSDIIINFSQNRYDYIRDDDTTYSDGRHLSKIGGKKVMQVINKYIDLP